MTGIEEIRAGISATNEKSAEGIAALQQAASSFEEAQQSLATAVRGSAQDEVLQAHGMLREAVDQIPYIQNTVKASMEATEAYLGRL